MLCCLVAYGPDRFGLELDSAMSSSGCHWAAVNMQSAAVSSCGRDEVNFVSPVAKLVVRCADAVALFQFYVLLSDAAGLWFSMYDAHFDLFVAAMLSGCAGCSVGPQHAVPSLLLGAEDGYAVCGLGGWMMPANCWPSFAAALHALIEASLDNLSVCCVLLGCAICGRVRFII
ncbi:hypothetical protein Nepgr_018763 [Nepenthes gracilis]|uniref:Uncharacterized protein n=1 Tax=Nepenthes gracilis TaxID=150966 RepID=A0AAD3SUR3_NEPGR|nr:hypothetical protein Nepgr_018763 [Nepenthes gracilis]